jgi:DNA-binding NarL/FixJ family response regulator
MIISIRAGRNGTSIALGARPRIRAITGLALSAGTDEDALASCNGVAVSETVVIVDDNDEFRSRTRALLDGDGYRVIGDAADGSSGLEAVRALRPDVALLDVQLPDTTGFAVAERLRRQAETAVVIVSTRDASDYAGAVGDCGARGFIAKSEICGDALRAVLGDAR